LACDALGLSAGERVMVSAEVDNLLTPGRYFIHCGISRAHAAGVALYVNSAVDFVVFGGETTSHGLVHLPHEIETKVESGERR